MSKTNLAYKDNTFEIDSSVAIDNQNTINLETQNVNELKHKKILYKITKRIIDIIGAIVGLILLIPATIGIYIARKILKEDDGPIFYEQLRYGKNGKMFRIYKYRSMCMNADKMLEKYLAENEEARIEYKKYKKLKDDPRITKIGKFLRKASLDEFPQFINVLMGNMSLVGPRPYLPKEKEDMGINYNKIMTVKPGITGYWQVNGRNDVDFEERVYMDTYYIDHRGIIMDIKILLKTVLKILKKEGAV